MNSLETKNKARELRAQGWSLIEIAKQFNVAKSTVCYWVKDIIIPEEYLKKHNEKSRSALITSNIKQKIDAHNLRESFQNEGKELAQSNCNLYAMGCMLYWGEGDKNRTRCGISNSDPALVNLFIRFLKECFLVIDEKIALHISCYTGNGLTVEDIENYWVKVLNLPKSCLRKTTINAISKCSKQVKPQNQLLYGTMHLSVYDVSIVQKIYGSIKYYGNITDDKWID